jgi:CHAT domain-containing protein/tetratricopeptide (TPR) repeat protein
MIGLGLRSNGGSVGQVRGRALSVAALLVMFAVGSSPARSGGNEQEDARLLPPEPVTREIATGESHAYTVALKAGELFRAVVEPDGVELAVALDAPGGASTVRVGTGVLDAVPLSVVAQRAGQYALRVQFSGGCRPRGKYKLVVDARRQARPSDVALGRADRAYTSGLDAARRQDSAALEHAVPLFDTAARLYASAGDSKFAARALNDRGAACLLLGDTKRALAAYTRAVDLARRAGDAVGEAAAWNGISETQYRIGDGDAAVQAASRGLSSSTASGDARGEATAYVNSSQAHSGLLSELEPAVRHAEAARSRFEKLGNHVGLARALHQLGFVYFLKYDFDTAEATLRQSLAYSRACGDRRRAASVLNDLAFVVGTRGEYQESFKMNAEAIAELRALGDANQEALALNGLATVSLEMGDQEGPLRAYERAVLLFERSGDRSGVVATLDAMANVYLDRKEPARALPLITRSLAIARELRLQFQIGHLMRSLGRAALLGGDAEGARRRCEESAAILSAAGEPQGEAKSLLVLGQALEALGKIAEARKAFDRAVEIGRATRSPVGELRGLYAAARLARDGGTLDEARRLCEAALGVVESTKRAIAGDLSRSTYYASAHRISELYADVLMRLHEREPGAGHAARAFVATESARARSLLELLGQGRSEVTKGADPAQLARLHDLESSLRKRAAAQFGLLAENQEEEVKQLEAEIDDLTLRVENVRAQIRASSPRFAALTQPATVDVATIQRDLLDKETALLMYALGDDRSYLWLVTPSEFATFVLPPRAAVEAKARRLYDLLRAPAARPGDDAARAAATRELSDTLLGQAAGPIAGKRLLVVADGALHYIPFSALVEPRGTAYLADGHEVVMLPSASILAQIRADAAGRPRPAGNVAVIADPVFEASDPRLAKEGARAGARPRPARSARPAVAALRALGGRDGAGAIAVPRLLASREEARAIVEAAGAGATLRALDFDASRETVLSGALARYRVVHFATHGLLDAARPSLSGVVLSLVDRTGRPADGFLRVNDLYNLDLPVDLVVLSACDTGLGRELRGEGFVGLARGFMYAGASRVMATLWRVDDEATAEFMRLFYGAMFGDGLAPAAALRRAQAEMRAKPRWSAPFYWAGFVLQGEWR